MAKIINKQFSLSQLKEVNKIYDEFIEIPVTVGENEHIIKLYPIFKPEKIRDMVEDMIDFYKKANVENIDIKDSDETDIIGYFVVKHFTDAKTVVSDTAQPIYDEFKLLINSELYKAITSIIPHASMEKVYEYIGEVIKVSAELQKTLKKQQDEIKKLDLKNKDILVKS